MFKKILAITKNLFFPLTCLHCGIKITENHLCLPCQNQIKLLFPPNCYTRLKLNCQSQDSLTVNSICTYRGPMRNLIHSFKYNNCDYLSKFLSQLIIKQLKTIKFNALYYDFIVPVPLHPYKIKLRGYNQAELIAFYIAKYFQLPLKNDIIISKYIKNSQTKFSSRKRKENVRGKFITKKDLSNTNIILIDDVFTTGSTISACWRSLKEKGANKIYAITLAR